MSTRGTQRHANPKLVSSLRHRIGNYAIQADCCQHQGETGKDAKNPGREMLVLPLLRLRDPGAQVLSAGEGLLFGIHRMHLREDWPNHRGSRSLGPHQNLSEVNQPKCVGHKGCRPDRFSQATVEVILDDTHDLQPRLRSVLGGVAQRWIILDGRKFYGVADGVSVWKIELCHGPVNDSHVCAITVLGRIPDSSLKLGYAQ